MTLPVLGEIEQAAQSCIHCGLCLEECPTYLELGNEMDSPRGRILLMRRIGEGALAPSESVREHLDLCLVCRACEAVCPSGVRYGHLIEATREYLHEQAPPRRGLVGRLTDLLTNLLIYHVTPYPRRLRAAVRMARWARRLGVMRLAAMLSPALGKAAAMLPDDAGSGRALRLPGCAAATGRAPVTACAPTVVTTAADAFVPATNPTRDRVALFTGCATSVLTPETLMHTHAVLRHNGCAVACPVRQVCCGAIFAHGGRMADARRLARENIDAFIDADANCNEGGEPIIVIAAGCGAMLRQYGELLADDAAYASRAAAFARRVRDISEFLVQRGPHRPQPSPHGPQRAVAQRVTYHDACHHVHVQGIRSAPRQLLGLIPGVELVEARESTVCCGAAGSYNLTQPETAARLGQRKLANLLATGAEVVATGNVGCILHLRGLAAAAGAPLRIEHTVDLLHEAYGLNAGAPR